jgi:hypothetical protein
MTPPHPLMTQGLALAAIGAEAVQEVAEFAVCLGVSRSDEPPASRRR